MGSILADSIWDNMQKEALIPRLHRDGCHYYVELAKGRQPEQRFKVMDDGQSAANVNSLS